MGKYFYSDEGLISSKYKVLMEIYNNKTNDFQKPYQNGEKKVRDTF